MKKYAHQIWVFLHMPRNLPLNEIVQVLFSLSKLDVQKFKKIIILD